MQIENFENYFDQNVEVILRKIRNSQTIQNQRRFYYGKQRSFTGNKFQFLR